LTDGLYQAIREWKERLTNTLQVVSLKENVGVGAAKNIGIEMCNCELIAVMDTDDVSLPKRFEKQLAVLPISQRTILHQNYFIRFNRLLIPHASHRPIKILVAFFMVN
jgi:glycosyltransferase involved in cell wall biosynthesis